MKSKLENQYKNSFTHKETIKKFFIRETKLKKYIIKITAVKNKSLWGRNERHHVCTI